MGRGQDTPDGHPASMTESADSVKRRMILLKGLCISLPHDISPKLDFSSANKEVLHNLPIQENLDVKFKMYEGLKYKKNEKKDWTGFYTNVQSQASIPF